MVILIDANSQYFNMFGYERSELIGKQVVPFTLAPESIEKFKKQIDTKTTSSYEVVGMRKDGSKFPIEINAKYIQYKDIDELISQGVPSSRKGSYLLLTERFKEEDVKPESDFPSQYPGIEKI